MDTARVLPAKFAQVDCRYINLESQQERKEQIELDFRSKIRAPWTLRRFAARTPVDVAMRGTTGNISEREKACFLSHLDLLAEAADSAHPLLVLEDDTTFGSKTQQCVTEWMEKLSRTPWDILFTDVIIGDVPTMAQLFRLKRELGATQPLTLIDLSLIPFAGAMSYVINGPSKAKVVAALREFRRLDVPFDLCLRDLIHQKKLTGIALFPFVTTGSIHSRKSQIQSSVAATSELLLQTYRRLVWLESEPQDCVEALAELRDALCDDELNAFGTLVAAMSSEKLLIK